MIKMVRKIFMITEKQAEQLRKMAFVNRASQSSIIRYMFDEYINRPKEGK
jgi:hypothetical protein